jgi:hypothetical protein
VHLSPVAIQHDHRKDAITRRVPWGLLVHTTGRGITTKAKKLGRSEVDVALDYYRSSQNGSNGYPWGGPGYVLGHWGDLHQIAPDDVMTMHCGGPYRNAYLRGEWVSMCSMDMVARWKAQWYGYRSPQHLFPSKTPNTDYVGVEMVPLIPGMGPAPMRKGLLFSREQHQMVICLARDLAKRHRWPAGWHRSPRLLGHEDVQPVRSNPHGGRSDDGGGWDPGWLRSAPYFDFGFVRDLLDS